MQVFWVVVATFLHCVQTVILFFFINSGFRPVSFFCQPIKCGRGRAFFMEAGGGLIHRYLPNSPMGLFSRFGVFGYFVGRMCYLKILHLRHSHTLDFFEFRVFSCSAAGVCYLIFLRH